MARPRRDTVWRDVTAKHVATTPPNPRGAADSSDRSVGRPPAAATTKEIQ